MCRSAHYVANWKARAFSKAAIRRSKSSRYPAWNGINSLQPEREEGKRKLTKSRLTIPRIGLIELFDHGIPRQKSAGTTLGSRVVTEKNRGRFDKRRRVHGKPVTSSANERSCLSSINSRLREYRKKKKRIVLAWKYKKEKRTVPLKHSAKDNEASRSS